jgi:pyrimidine operon attenuation protein/uracil phosphoribosyltransferase
MTQLLDAAGLAATLDRLAEQLHQEFIPESETVLVGVRSRGVPLAHRLKQRLEARGLTVPAVGVLDITFYRDDLSQRRRWPTVRGTAIPYPLDQRRVLLVDDVLHTGRTAFAALTALGDLGRPAVIRLVALVDRGNREYPLQADYAGLRVDATLGDRVNVRLLETDGVDEVVVL